NATQKVPRPITSEPPQAVVTALSDSTMHSPEPADVVAALRRQARYQISFWDAMILGSAASLGCGLVWSEDLSSGQVYDGVEVRNPFDESS
ncbi:MAG: PIN domain-containing protein, partial [bacterium]|nr:PIN domain-containing protein [bacterium]